MPRVIQPPGGMPEAPKNSTLVQLGFMYGLNFPFVYKTKDSANQIFEFLPKGVSTGLNIPEDQVVMYALRPYDTAPTLGYVTTLALTYIPSDMFDKLNLDIHIPASDLYSSDNPPVNTLMGLVNPAIPLLAGSLPNDNGNPTNSYGAKPTTSDGPGGAPLGRGGNTNSPVVASSVGIAFAAIGGVTVYGAAMFFVARRYRKKRQGHLRSSSVTTTGRSSGGSYGGVWMSGGRGPGRSPGGRYSQGSRGSGSSSNGRSIRTQQISAPVMAENSLGWNWVRIPIRIRLHFPLYSLPF
jgi:hypothetical protein